MCELKMFLYAHTFSLFVKKQWIVNYFSSVCMCNMKAFCISPRFSHWNWEINTLTVNNIIGQMLKNEIISSTWPTAYVVSDITEQTGSAETLDSFIVQIYVSAALTEFYFAVFLSCSWRRQWQYLKIALTIPSSIPSFFLYMMNIQCLWPG